MSTIALDLDDTVIRLVDNWLRIYNEMYHDDLKIENILTWDIYSYVKCSKEKFTAIINNQTFYNSCKPVLDALEGIDFLRKQGHRVIFVTNAMNGHAGAKLRWLQDHLVLPKGELSSKDYIETADKTLVNADIFIDDNVDYINAVRKIGKRGIIFTRPWNKDAEGERVHNWKQIMELFKIPTFKYDATNIYITGTNIANFSISNNTFTSAVKFDDGKAEWHLYPISTITDVNQILKLGKNKYGEDNWKKGFKFSKVYNALLRHLSAWWSGEDNDPESGLSHLAHVICNAVFLLYYMQRYDKYKEWDNRE